MSQASELEDLRRALMELRAEVRKMESCIKQFREEYEPLLKALVLRGNFRRELGTHLLKGTMLALALSLAGAIVLVLSLGARAWFKGWLG